MSIPSPSRYTPKYHFYTPSHEHCRPFDPNGAIYYNGRYHLFYIFQNPQLPHRGNCWGHASSVDMLEWVIHPPALVPDDQSPEVGIFSGCALIDKHGRPTLVYHGVGSGCCIATAQDDDLIRWKKSAHNPVVPETIGKPQDQVYHVFDPHVWREADHYVAIFGSRAKPFLQRDTAYMFRSDDLVHWEYLRPFYMPNDKWTEPCEDMACPDFFKLEDRYVLMGISHLYGARYYLGDYIAGTFVPQSHHRLNHPGGSLFAPESCLDDQGRRIVWFWMTDQQLDAAPQSGNQIMALPRVMSLDAESGKVHWEIPEQYKQLRGHETCFDAIELAGDSKPMRLPDITSNAFELEMVISEMSDKIVLRVLESSDSREYAQIIIDPQAGIWGIDSSRMGSRKDVYNSNTICQLPGISLQQENTPFQKAPFTLHEGEKLHLRVFVDCSVIEIFANGRNAMSQRVYPTSLDCLHVSLLSATKFTIDSLRCWDMGELTYSIESTR